MQIYVSKDGQSFVPYSEDNYKKYLESSVFTEEHLVCIDGHNWVPPFEVLSFNDIEITEQAREKEDLTKAKGKNIWKKIKYISLGIISLGGIFLFVANDYSLAALILYLMVFFIPYLVIKFVLFVIKRVREYKPKSQILTEDARIFLDSLQRSKSLASVHTKIILKKDEIAYYSESSKLFETKAVRHYQSGSAGVRVMKGVYIGGSRGKSTSHQEWSHIDDGNLIITNQRLIFDGFSQNRNFNLSRIISVSQGLDKIEVSIEGRQKSLVFECSNSIICATVIHICAQTENPSDLSNVNLDIEIEEPK